MDDTDRIARLEQRVAELSEAAMNLYLAVGWMRVEDRAVDYRAISVDKEALAEATSGVESGLSEVRRLLIVDGGPDVVR